MITAVTQCGTTYCNEFEIGTPISSGGTMYINDMVLMIGTNAYRTPHIYSSGGSSGSGISGGGGGGSSLTRSIITPQYDIIISVKKSMYQRSDNVEAEIIIISKMNQDDTNGYLTTYLFSNNKTYKSQDVNITIIPPTCQKDYYYNWYEDICVGADNITDAKKTVITRKVALPTDARFGEWRLYAEFKTDNQATIKIFDRFNVYSMEYAIAIFGIVGYFAFTSSKPKKKGEGRKQ